MGAQTVVADVADELARRVAAGEYTPGDLMPSVRQVAEEFAMNRATAQLILGRLESHGFVEAHRGKGFTIRDVREEGGVEVYRRLFRLSLPRPEVAVEMFRDIVTMQRQIVMDALLAYTAAPHGVERAVLERSIDELETLARQLNPDLPAILAGELALVRTLLSALGHSMQRAVLNSIGEMILEVPTAVEAYYAVGPDLHVLMWRALAAVWDSDGGPSDAQVALFEDLFGMFHERVVAHFDEEVVGGAETATAATA
ncbi:DNA-binding FadR family transcriptional regulator [Nocardia transvalensis]|uniref:DNA-binding FadR family transcriptional regulator n=1 Tax=Nocardia transvalensis TaxID=37333 RepID=A0A7W9PHS1_9NOCA|nr:GntR family transcriptional regulator [Nocardia transvalensis]MBB5916374.1 DNA-binding FadR family transcriptional regulator [Nocardia transvalensis]